MPPEKGATGVPHKTRQPGAIPPEKKRDASCSGRTRLNKVRSRSNSHQGWESSLLPDDHFLDKGLAVNL
jgi:hypothetical protein